MAERLSHLEFAPSETVIGIKREEFLTILRDALAKQGLVPPDINPCLMAFEFNKFYGGFYLSIRPTQED